MKDESEKLKEELGEELCVFCPWMNGDIQHRCNSLCEGLFCDEALDFYLEKRSNEDET